MNMLKSIVSPFVFVAVLSVALHAQMEDEHYYIDDFVVSATEEEQNLLNNAETLHRSEINQLKEEARRIEKQIQSLERDEKAKIDKLLNPEQKRAIAEQRLASVRERVAENKVFLQGFSIFAKQLAATEKFKIYEGLPRGKPMELAKITANSETIEIDGFKFYAEPLNVDLGTAEKLREVLANYQDFSLTSPGGKFCGGFHPDLLLKFRANDTENRVHICTGCFEILFVTPNQKRNFDFNRSAWDVIVEIANSTMIHGRIVHPLLK